MLTLNNSLLCGDPEGCNLTLNKNFQTELQFDTPLRFEYCAIVPCTWEQAKVTAMQLFA
jgi:hypothetical protein